MDDTLDCYQWRDIDEEIARADEWRDAWSKNILDNLHARQCNLANREREAKIVGNLLDAQRVMIEVLAKAQH